MLPLRICNLYCGHFSQSFVLKPNSVWIFRNRLKCCLNVERTLVAFCLLDGTTDRLPDPGYPNKQTRGVVPMLVLILVHRLRLWPVIKTTLSLSLLLAVVLVGPPGTWIPQLRSLGCNEPSWIRLLCNTGATQQAREIDPILVWCWANVVDGGPTPIQHWLNVWCLLGRHSDSWDETNSIHTRVFLFSLNG